MSNSVAQHFSDSLKKQLQSPELIQQNINNGRLAEQQIAEVIQENYAAIDIAKRRANAIRYTSTENLEKLLVDFEYTFTRKNGKLVWCDTEQDIHDELLRLIQKNKTTAWTNHLSAELSEEIALTKFFKSQQIDLSPNEKSNIQIHQAQFIAADSGGAILINQPLLNNNKTTIIITTIDAIIPKIADIDLFVPLYSTYAQKQFMCSSMNIVFGNEDKAKDETILFILNNGRTKILEQVQQRSALYCIGCNLCAHVCPITHYAGEQAYQSVSKGPIAQVKNQFQYSVSDHKHLSNACTLCSKCSSVCPVEIDIHNQLINNRRYLVEKKLNNKSDNLAVFFWKNNMLKRSKLDQGGASLKNFMLKQFFKKQWGENREFPVVQNKSFNQLWKEKNQTKNS